MKQENQSLYLYGRTSARAHAHSRIDRLEHKLSPKSSI